MKLLRSKVISDMEKDQRECRRSNVPEDEIIHYLIEKHSPSELEFRYVRHPLATYMPDPKHDGGLLAERMQRQEIRLWNKNERLGQQIAAKKVSWQTLDNKIRKVWLLVLAAGDVAIDAAKRADPIIEGWKEKKKKLLDKGRNSHKFRARAKRTQMEIERKKSRGAGRRP